MQAKTYKSLPVESCKLLLNTKAPNVCLKAV